MPIKPSKFASKNAQHTMEYIILLTLIMAGIIIGGPYVTRSWNAQMKGWEDSAIDSMNDPLVEAPIGSVPLAGCDADPWTPGLCGPAGSPIDCAGRITNCQPRYKLFTRTFTPNGCQCNVPAPMIPAISAECRQDNSFNCCTDWVTPSGCTFGTTPPAGCLVPGTDCGVNAGCPDGQYRRARNCDVDETENLCVNDGSCIFSCTSPMHPGPAYSSPCAGDETRLPSSMTYAYVTTSADCTSRKCEITCAPTFISYGTWCGCPGGASIVGGICQCAAGFVEQCSSGPNAGNSNYCNICNTGPNAGNPAYCQQ